MRSNGYEGIDLELQQRQANATEESRAVLEALLDTHRHVLAQLTRIADHFDPPKRSFTDIYPPYDQ